MEPDLGDLVVQACWREATARKIGNVHRFADFPDLTYPDLLTSAVAVAPIFRHAPRQTLGETILAAVSAVRRAVATNTNLGIILALAPLATVPPDVDLRVGVGHVLAATTIEDADAVYRAIRLAQPGGLGKVAEQDVQARPTVTLRDAMRLAQDRDSIARQYTTDFAEVFTIGVPALCAGIDECGTMEGGILACQLAWLAHVPDSLIARKFGSAAASAIQAAAQRILGLGGRQSDEGRTACRRLDEELRHTPRRNPGTTADLVTASLFAAARIGLIPVGVPFSEPSHPQRSDAGVPTAIPDSHE